MLMIVRYSKPIRFPSGNCSNIQCISGEPEEIREKAEKIAKRTAPKWCRLHKEETEDEVI